MVLMIMMMMIMMMVMIAVLIMRMRMVIIMTMIQVMILCFLRLVTEKGVFDYKTFSRIMEQHITLSKVDAEEFRDAFRIFDKDDTGTLRSVRFSKDIEPLCSTHILNHY